MCYYQVTLEAASSAQGFVGYFDVRFCGREAAPANHCVELTTSPHAPPTHWGQTALLLDPLASSGSLTVGLTSCSRSIHDLNFTVGYDGGHASYSISADFRGYHELDNAADKGDDDAADDGRAEAGGGEQDQDQDQDDADGGTDYE